MPIYYYNTPLGVILLDMVDDRFTSIQFAQTLSPHKAQDLYTPLPNPFAADLQHYFKGKPITFTWPLDLQGTPFQQAVWQELQKIPYGTTVTYKQIAQRLSTRGYQAVGQAVGANPFVIIVPCHRVLGSEGFGGYSYGLPVKRFLLELENAFPQRDHC